MSDYFTSTVEGARGYAKMHREPEHEPDYYDYEPDKEETDWEEEEVCNCSDPGCPCGGTGIVWG